MSELLLMLSLWRNYCLAEGFLFFFLESQRSITHPFITLELQTCDR